MMPFPVTRQSVTATQSTGSDISVPADPRTGNMAFSAVMTPSSGQTKRGEKAAEATDTPAGSVPVTPVVSPSDQQSLFHSLQAQSAYPAQGLPVTTAASAKTVETSPEEGQTQDMPPATGWPAWYPVNAGSTEVKTGKIPPAEEPPQDKPQDPSGVVPIFLSPVLPSGIQRPREQSPAASWSLSTGGAASFSASGVTTDLLHHTDPAVTASVARPLAAQVPSTFSASAEPAPAKGAEEAVASLTDSSLLPGSRGGYENADRPVPPATVAAEKQTQATASPVTQLFSLSVGHEEPRQQQLTHALGEHLQWQVSQQIQSAEVRLHPAELGSIAITLHLESGKTAVHLSAEMPETQQLLQQTASDLKDKLVVTQGGQVQVDVSAQGDQQRRQAQREQQEKRGISVARKYSLASAAVAPTDPSILMTL